MPSENNSNQIRLTRVYDAPVRAVWDAWTVPSQVEKWWGPRGFTLTTHSRDLRPGGTWRYTMHGPDGVDYPNITTYFVVEPYAKLVYDHGATDDSPPLFRVNATFSEHHGKTTLELTFTLATAEAARQTAKFIKQVGGNATWDRLAEHLEETATGKPKFVINRSFDAKISQVYEMWTNPSHLAKWLPPPDTQLQFLRSEIKQGKSTLFVITGKQGKMHVRAEYLALEAPHRIVYSQQFVDENERPASAPGAEHWPTTLRVTVEFAEEGPAATRVTLTMSPEGAASSADTAAFVAERSGMTLGWTASFDTLEQLLE